MPAGGAGSGSTGSRWRRGIRPGPRKQIVAAFGLVRQRLASAIGPAWAGRRGRSPPTPPAGTTPPAYWSSSTTVALARSSTGAQTGAAPPTEGLSLGELPGVACGHAAGSDSGANASPWRRGRAKAGRRTPRWPSAPIGGEGEDRQGAKAARSANEKGSRLAAPDCDTREDCLSAMGTLRDIIEDREEGDGYPPGHHRR